MKKPTSQILTINSKKEKTTFLNIVISQSSAIFQLLSSKNQPLLVRWNPFSNKKKNSHFYIYSFERVGDYKGGQDVPSWS
jgi:hypothetical protein